MQKQITRLGTGYAIPAANLNQFPPFVTPPLTGQITMLASYSMPGQRYIFPSYNPVPITLQGIFTMVLNFIGTLATPTIKIIQITRLASYSMPGPALAPVAPVGPTISFQAAFATVLQFVGFIGGLEEATEMSDQDINFCQQNDVGVALVYQCLDPLGNIINLKTATGLTLRIGYPDNTEAVPHTLDRAASLFTDGSDGNLVYITVGGDLFQFGLYTIQGKITIGGRTISGTKQPLRVRQNVDNN